MSKLIELGTKLRFYALRREEERNVGRVKRVCERQRQNSIHIITTISIHPLFHISCPISRSLYITLPLLHMLLAYDNMKKGFLVPSLNNNARWNWNDEKEFGISLLKWRQKFPQKWKILFFNPTYRWETQIIPLL